jgi:hypothetical protein
VALIVTLYLNTISLEDWTPGQAAERWCRVTIVERYSFDGESRLKVRIEEGPEAGRVVSGLSPGNLRDEGASP